MNKNVIYIVGATVLLGGGAFLFLKNKKKKDLLKLAEAEKIAEIDKQLGGTTSGGTTSGGTTSGGTTSGGTTSGGTKPNFVINSASYGEGNKKIDVKKNLEDLLKTGIYEFKATNQFFGKDPFRGRVKYVTVDYTINGVKVPLSKFNSQTIGFRSDIDGVREGQLVTLYKKT